MMVTTVIDIYLGPPLAKEINTSIDSRVFQVVFWVLASIVFAVYTKATQNTSVAFQWINGYILEVMLSFDTLFVFTVIFRAYKTPDVLKNAPMLWGMAGAVGLRMFMFQAFGAIGLS